MSTLESVRTFHSSVHPVGSTLYGTVTRHWGRSIWVVRNREGVVDRRGMWNGVTATKGINDETNVG